MAKPSDPDLCGGSLESTLIGQLARLACWQPDVLNGLTEGWHRAPRQKLQDWQIIVGLRLLGIDGTQFDLLNTPQIKATVTKAATRRGEAAPTPRKNGKSCRAQLS